MQQSYPGVSVRVTCGFQASVYSPRYASSFAIFKVRVCFLFLFLCPSAIAPDFSQNLLKAQTLTRQGGDVLIECKPRMSPRGIISWRKGKEALRENHRYTELCVCVCVFSSFTVIFHQLVILCFPAWYSWSQRAQS